MCQYNPETGEITPCLDENQRFVFDVLVELREHEHSLDKIIENCRATMPEPVLRIFQESGSCHK